jgi:hypothetical protein
MVHIIYRPKGPSPFISNFSGNSDISDFFSVSPDASDVLSLVHRELLDASVDHILLGDFNLHHPLCGDDQAATDNLSESFISFYNAHFLNLLLPQGSITRSENGHEMTIDLFLHPLHSRMP